MGDRCEIIGGSQLRGKDVPIGLYGLFRKKFTVVKIDRVGTGARPLKAVAILEMGRHRALINVLTLGGFNHHGAVQPSPLDALEPG